MMTTLYNLEINNVSKNNQLNINLYFQEFHAFHSFLSTTLPAGFVGNFAQWRSRIHTKSMLDI